LAVERGRGDRGRGIAERLALWHAVRGRWLGGSAPARHPGEPEVLLAQHGPCDGDGLHDEQVGLADSRTWPGRAWRRGRARAGTRT
jgi:hypothetical protein